MRVALLFLAACSVLASCCLGCRPDKVDSGPLPMPLVTEPKKPVTSSGVAVLDEALQGADACAASPVDSGECRPLTKLADLFNAQDFPQEVLFKALYMAKTVETKRIVIGKGLAFHMDDSSIRLLEKFLADPQLADVSLTALSKHGSELALQKLVALLDRPDMRTRVPEFLVPHVLNPLVQKQGSKFREIAASLSTTDRGYLPAVAAYSAVETRNAVPFLIEQLSRCKDEHVRAMVVRELGNYASSGKVKARLEELASEERTEAGQEARRALGR